MAENLQFQINYAGGSYIDACMSVSTISELLEKFDFIGQSVHMAEAFAGANGISYPIDFWMTPNGEDVKWEVKTLPSIETEEDLVFLKAFMENFKGEAGYYPLVRGFEFLVDGEVYMFDIDENGNAIYTSKQNKIDNLITDIVENAVEEAVGKVTSGASEAFDTLQEIEAWINANSGNTPDFSGYATEQWVKEQNYLTEHQDISGLATKEEVADAVEGLASETYVNEQIAAIEFPETDLTGYATEQWVEGKGYLTEHQDISGLATKEEVADAVEGLATEEFVTSQGYLTEHQDISGLATKEEVSEAVEGLATEEFVTEQIAAIEFPETDLTGYATEQWVEGKGYLTEHQDISGLATKEEVNGAVKGLATETWVSAEIAKAQLEGEDVDLSGYATKDDIKGLASEQYVDEKIANIQIPSVDGLASEEYVDEKIANIEFPETDLTGYATEQWVEGKGYLTEHQDISGLATKEEVADAVEGLATEEFVTSQGYLTEHQDISGLATKEEVADAVEGLASEAYVNEQIAAIEFPETDLTGYATEQWVEGKGYLTEHQDISGLATKEEVADAVEGLATEEFVTSQGYLTEHQSLEGYATEEFVTSQGYLTEHQDISGLATKEEVSEAVEGLATEEFVTEQIAAIEFPETDLTGYATEQWVEGKGYLTAHQSLEGYAKESWVTEYVVSAVTGGQVSLDGYATEEFVNEQIAAIEFPETDLTGYATEQWVKEQNYLTEHQDISGLATKEEVSEAVEGLATEEFVTEQIAAIEFPETDLTGYATEQWVEGKGYLTEHQDISGLATKEEVSAVSASIKTVIEELLIPENAQDSLDTIEEISAWIQSHPEDAATMNAQIQSISAVSHTHENKEVLDGITEDKVVAWDSIEENVKTWVGEQEYLTEHQDISGLATKEEVADAVEGLASETWVEGKGYLTEHQDISGLATKEEVSEAVEGLASEEFVTEQIAAIEFPETDLTGYATEQWVEGKGYLTEHQDISGLATKEEVADAVKGLATEEFVTSQGYLTEHQDISGLATKEETAQALTEAKDYADELVENIKPYNSGVATDIIDYAVNVKVATDTEEKKNFLDVNSNNELEVSGITIDATVTSKDIQIEGGQWADAVKTVFSGGTVPAGTTLQSFLEKMLCTEKWATTVSASTSFTVSCGNLDPKIDASGTVENGTKVTLGKVVANETNPSQTLTVKTFTYGYKLGEDGVYNSATAYTETLTPTLKTSNDALKVTFSKFVDASGNTLTTVTGNTSIDAIEMYVRDGKNEVVVSQTGDTYTSSSAVTAGTIYIATNLKNYYKKDEKTMNTYVPTVSSTDKTATDSTIYSVTGSNKYFIGDVMDYSADYWETDRSETIQGLKTSGWTTGSSITVAHTFAIGTKQQTVAVPSKYSSVSGKDENNGDVKFNLMKTFDFTNKQGYVTSYKVFVAPATDGLGSNSKITITIK